ASPSGSPYRFTGRRLDAETGLYYYRARYYSPAQGRFLSPDPIGYGDGMNMYAYVGNDPINFVDPSGLAAEGAANLGKKTWNYASNNPLETFHYAMDGGGMTPVVGIFADALNAVVYTGEAGYHAVTGDFGRAGSAIGNAGVSVGAMVPGAGQGVTATKWAAMGLGAAKRANPLNGTKYTDKVMRQMDGKDLDHNFPSLIDKQADAATVRKITGGDGISRTKVELPGSINGKDGNFSWIIEPDNTINHRQFERIRKK
ncbi:MAG: RHS repeat-associated core domain-containing protein, partial [Sneathiella sp.]